MADASDPRIAEAYADVRSNTSPTNWLLVGYKDNKTLQLEATGTGGATELASKFQENSCNYGYLRVEYKDEETSRTKFVFLTWKGESAPVMRKGNMSVHVSAVKAVVRDYSVEVNATEKGEVTDEDVLKKVRAANY
eukprot:TRINITY_DN311_c0_g1_i1.p2 TRINITY_DN311_c0_g1~~TRINITY_DN311_c0_g1_i1.p2  ORF type:complete len:136 (-),score=47.36 TRINITY_DN311_c0_g1_i1:120-527(-)